MYPQGQKVVMAPDAAVAAGATNPNLFTGQTYERAPFNGYLDLYLTGSAAGLLAELIVGGNLVAPQQAVNTQNRVPVVPDDILIAGVPVYAGQLIQMRVQNPTGGALTIRSRAEMYTG